MLEIRHCDKEDIGTMNQPDRVGFNTALKPPVMAAHAASQPTQCKLTLLLKNCDTGRGVPSVTIYSIMFLKLSFYIVTWEL